MVKPCAQCPWRAENHGKRHPNGFYTKRNLRRLWNQVRKGGGVQSCHMTDTNHPDHVEAGAKGDQVHECMGSVVLVWRELRAFESILAEVGMDMDEGVPRYLAERRRNVEDGLAYWLTQQADGSAVRGRQDAQGPGRMAGRPSLRPSAQVRRSVRQQCHTRGRKRKWQRDGVVDPRKGGESILKKRGKDRGGGAAGATVAAQASRRAGGTKGGGGA